MQLLRRCPRLAAYKRFVSIDGELRPDDAYRALAPVRWIAPDTPVKAPRPVRHQQPACNRPGRIVAGLRNGLETDAL